MGKLLVLNFKDVNGLNSNTSFWCPDLTAAEGAMQNAKNLSNAAIISAYLVQILSLEDVSDNNAVAANNETVKVKGKVRLSGPNAAGEGAPRLSVTVSIPAAKGEIINELTGDVAGELVTPFLSHVVTHTGLVPDRIDKVFYSRSH